MVSFVWPRKVKQVPAWALHRRELLTIAQTVQDACAVSEMPDLVVLPSAHERYAERTEVRNLIDRLNSGLNHTFLVCNIEKLPLYADEVDPLLRGYPVSRLEFALGQSELESAFEKALLKWQLLGQETSKPQPNSKLSQFPDDPLGESQVLTDVTRDLRSATGRLSAAAIATLFGISQARLAQVLGKNRATVNKTPDAPALQPLLHDFERIARLRVIFSDEDFRAWLNRPNDLLDGETPLALILQGYAIDVADFAENMLTGAPT